MPHRTDESDANTVPDPELNPLLNPLLAAHMGRWAEVYFTNPPEKRGQAIAELLRELENISPPEPASVPVLNDERAERKIETAEGPDSSPAGPVVTCGACAHSNSAGQLFCGMCGGRLPVPPEALVPQVAKAMPIVGASWREPEPSLSRNSVEYAIEPAVRSTTAGGRHNAPEPTRPLPEKDSPDLGVESEPVPRRYRLYIGVVLAILLAVLVYVAWRGTKALPGATAPQPASSRAIPPAPATSAKQPSTTGATLPMTNPPASPLQRQNQPEASSHKDQAADARPVPHTVPVAASSSAIAVEQSGVEELGTAEKYLSGNHGMTRDSREAAQWLWKAVGKGNLAATMALSDLYLRGDGVPKNCDQARLLLDAAARKGGTTAAQRLRNLQAFGCE